MQMVSDSASNWGDGGDLPSYANCLVVDDNSFNMLAIQSVLEQFNIESDTASDGIQAIELVKQRNKDKRDCYKLILLDYSMPNCDGVQTVKLLSKFMNTYMPLKKPPFICCISAYSSNKYRVNATAAGMHYYLSKPVGKDAMRVVLEKAGLIAEEGK